MSARPAVVPRRSYYPSAPHTAAPYHYYNNNAPARTASPYVYDPRALNEPFEPCAAPSTASGYYYPYNASARTSAGYYDGRSPHTAFDFNPFSNSHSNDFRGFSTAAAMDGLMVGAGVGAVSLGSRYAFGGNS